jgi:hypothetical protein
LVAKQIVNSVLVDVPKMGGWTPEMTLISEASKKEKELFVSVKDDVMAYFN